MITEANSDVHSPGGRFHFEYHRLSEPESIAAPANDCPGNVSASSSASRRLRLCATSDGTNYCGPHNLVAAETCGRLHGSRVITGLLTPFYRFPMQQCKRFDDLD